jgi:hypothetical protein
MFGNLIFWGILQGCGRPSANYEVGVFGKGSTIADIQSPSEEKSGLIEFGRYRIYGGELGLGFTGMYADIPDSSGTEFVLGQGVFAYPPNESFDRISRMVSTGPTQVDNCMTIMSPRTEGYSTEYIDVGDTLLLQNENIYVSLPRDPNIYPRPAGENWFVGYGNQLLPVLKDYPHKADTWSESAQELQISFSGSLPPKDATVGAVPFPSQGSIQLPESLQNVQINGVTVDRNTTSFSGIGDNDFTLTWNVATEVTPLTLSIRALGKGESLGDCTCNEDCGTGMICNDNSCFVEKGATDDQRGELVCTLEDDGEFVLQNKQIQKLLQNTQADTLGYLLVVSRMKTGDLEIPDVISHNGKRIPTKMVRWRTMDSILTRLEKAQ